MKRRSDAVPPEAFLAAYPPGIAAVADELRALVKRAVPEVIEAVRPGWRLIGYDLPLGRRTAYFAFVAPDREHVHLGFEHGVVMRDPDRLLRGDGITRQVRWVTVRPGDAIDDGSLRTLVREAARVAALPRQERLAHLLSSEAEPP